MRYDYPVTIHLNARFQPVDRFPLEDALENIFERLSLGTVSGGGTLQMKTGEIKSCDIEVLLKDGEQSAIDDLTDILNNIGIPKGSMLVCESGSVPVGTLEGLALYLNGTELSDDVYRTCDVNYVVSQTEKLMLGLGRMYSYWQGAENTALYFYGRSYDDMLSKIKPFLDDYPLCQKCTVDRIA